MDYMEQSTLHIKVPHTLHIATKVQAARSGRSMNQYLNDLINQDLKTNNIDLKVVEDGIKLAREVPHLVKDEYKDEPAKHMFPATKLCKIHAAPLDSRGRCLQKGCKYA